MWTTRKKKVILSEENHIVKTKPKTNILKKIKPKLRLIVDKEKS